MDDRQALCDAYRYLAERGLNRGCTGNLSLRHGDGFWITPSGASAARLASATLVSLDLAGESLSPGRPSSEWRLHRDIYTARPEAAAIVHTHSPHATALACLRRALPAFHYMVAIAGGPDVRCAPYALFGTEDLSAAVLAALDDRKACLLANHGLIALGADLEEAVAIAEEIEALCGQYLAACEAGEPVLLTGDEMAAVLARFATYGRAPAAEE
ncbi:MAG: class II aldolase/adducin family protein [Pseudohaliea sp.]